MIDKPQDNPHAMIRSLSNERLKSWLAMRRQSAGKPDGEVLLEGLRLCADAYASGAAINELIVSEKAGPAVWQWLATMPRGLRLTEVSGQVFARLAATENPQGIAAVARSPVLELADSVPSGGLWLVVDRVQDPGNLGSMIRSADAFGWRGVLVLPGSASPASEKVLRASMGSVFHLPVMLAGSAGRLAKWCAAHGLPLYAADAGGEPFSRWLARSEAQVRGGLALIIGNEANGVDPSLAAACNGIIRLEMAGGAESLNAAAAAAVFGYTLALVESAKMR